MQLFVILPDVVVTSFPLVVTLSLLGRLLYLNAKGIFCVRVVGSDLIDLGLQVVVKFQSFLKFVLQIFLNLSPFGACVLIFPTSLIMED